MKCLQVTFLHFLHFAIIVSLTLDFNLIEQFLSLQDTMSTDIITIDDEEVHSEDEQVKGK